MEIRLETLPYEHIRWIENTDMDIDKISLTMDAKKIKDMKGRPLILFTHPWSVQTVLERNEGLKLSEFGNVTEE